MRDQGLLGRALVLAATAGLLAGAPGARGQTLDLGTPEEPRLGDQAAALVLAAQLRAEEAGLRESGGADPALAVRSGVRRLAAALLEAGEREGRRGAGKVLLGRTLAGRAAVIDEVLGRPDAAADAGAPGGLDRAMSAVMAADLEGLISMAGGDLAAVEAGLRVALAPLADAWEAQESGTPAEAPAMGGWVTAGEGAALAEYRAIISRLTTEGTPLSGAAVEAVRAIDALVQEAEATRAFRRSAESVRLALLEAAPAAEAPPRWLAPPAVATVLPGFERALIKLADATRRAEGLEELRRVGVLMRLMRETDRLADDQSGRRAREALSSYIAAPPSNRELERQVLSAYERGLALALAPASLPDDRRLLRQLRPSWREFVDAARVATDRVAGVLPTLLNDSQAMTDPAVLALFNGARQALAEASGMLELTAWLAGTADIAPGTEPMPLDEYRELAGRLLTLAQAASRDGGPGDAARRSLGGLASDAGAWRIMVGEPGLRAASTSADPAWTSATEGRELDLLDLIDRTRGAYLANVTMDGTLVERAALRARLAMLADLLSLVEQVVAGERLLLVPTEGPGPAWAGLNAWAGWELSRQAQELLSEGLVDALGETVSLALRGEDERARIRIAAMRRDMAGALLPGRLALAWERAGMGAGGALDEVALGGPDPARAWLPADRAVLAEFCRAAGELAGVRLRRDDAQDRAVRAYLAMLAEDAMAEVGW